MSMDMGSFAISRQGLCKVNWQNVGVIDLVVGVNEGTQTIIGLEPVE